MCATLADIFLDELTGRLITLSANHSHTLMRQLKLMSTPLQNTDSYQKFTNLKLYFAILNHIDFTYVFMARQEQALKYSQCYEVAFYFAYCY